MCPMQPLPIAIAGIATNRRYVDMKKQVYPDSTWVITNMRKQVQPDTTRVIQLKCLLLLQREVGILISVGIVKTDIGVTSV